MTVSFSMYRRAVFIFAIWSGSTQVNVFANFSNISNGSTKRLQCTCFLALPCDGFKRIIVSQVINIKQLYHCRRSNKKMSRKSNTEKWDICFYMSLFREETLAVTVHYHYEFFGMAFLQSCSFPRYSAQATPLFEEMSQRWRTVGNTVLFDRPEIWASDSCSWDERVTARPIGYVGLITLYITITKLIKLNALNQRLLFYKFAFSNSIIVANSFSN